MCLARVRFAGDEEEEIPDSLTDVAVIERTTGGVRVTDLFGNATELEADIRSIDFMESLVSVEKRADSPPSRWHLEREIALRAMSGMRSG